MQWMRYGRWVVIGAALCVRASCLYGDDLAGAKMQSEPMGQVERQYQFAPRDEARRPPDIALGAVKEVASYRLGDEERIVVTLSEIDIYLDSISKEREEYCTKVEVWHEYRSAEHDKARVKLWEVRSRVGPGYAGRHPLPHGFSIVRGAEGMIGIAFTDRGTIHFGEFDLRRRGNMPRHVPDSERNILVVICGADSTTEAFYAPALLPGILGGGRPGGDVPMRRLEWREGHWHVVLPYRNREADLIRKSAGRWGWANAKFSGFAEFPYRIHVPSLRRFDAQSERALDETGRQETD